MDKRVHLVVGLMESGYSPNASVAELSGLVGLSPSRLSHLFRMTTGYSLHAYHKKLRLVKASQLLQSTLHSVKEVAATVGVTDESHFVRDFKRLFGKTPTQFRMMADVSRNG
jgi:AraC family transcriptional regulator of arabinose operon